MNARFYAPDARAPGDLIDLPDEEAQHAARVLRLRQGAAIRVFNGRGLEFDATIEALTRHGASVRVGDPRTSAPEPAVAVTLVQAVLKGDKMDDVVRDAVMLGVSAICPVVTTRTEISIAAVERSGRRERWQRVAVSSAKQCGRAIVPAIAEPRLFVDLLAAIAALTLPGPALMLAEPSAAESAVPLGEMDATPPRETSLIVGPEGGWDEHELALASQTCRLVSLGGRTIRADAMALVAVSAMFALWKEF